MLKRTACIVRRINIDTLNPPCKILLERLERNQVIPVNQHVFAAGIAVGFSPVFYQDTGLYHVLLVFAHPGQFKLSSVFHGFSPLSCSAQNFSTMFTNRTGLISQFSLKARISCAASVWIAVTFS